MISSFIFAHEKVKGPYDQGPCVPSRKFFALLKEVGRERERIWMVVCGEKVLG